MSNSDRIYKPWNQPLKFHKLIFLKLPDEKIVNSRVYHRLKWNYLYGYLRGWGYAYSLFWVLSFVIRPSWPVWFPFNNFYEAHVMAWEWLWSLL